MNQTLIATGVFFAYFFQTILSLASSQEDHWRACFGITLLTVFAQTLLLVFVFKAETPKYYLIQGYEEKCREIIVKIYKE